MADLLDLLSGPRCVCGGFHIANPQGQGRPVAGPLFWRRDLSPNCYLAWLELHERPILLAQGRLRFQDSHNVFKAALGLVQANSESMSYLLRPWPHGVTIIGNER